MRIAFDIDGVIVPIDLGLIRVIDHISAVIGEAGVKDIWRFYCGDKRIQLNPIDFLSEGDELFIITGRHIENKDITQKWVNQYFPNAKLIMVCEASVNELAGKDVKMAWYVQAARKKAKAINDNKIDVYFEDTAPVVRELRKMCPNTKIIQYGGRFDI